MTNLICPLCGKRSILETFDPSEFDLDVQTVKVHGLGRGRGFEEDEPYSILNADDETVIAIKDRLLSLLSLFIEHEVTNIEEIMKELGYEDEEE